MFCFIMYMFQFILFLVLVSVALLSSPYAPCSLGSSVSHCQPLCGLVPPSVLSMSSCVRLHLPTFSPKSFLRTSSVSLSLFRSGVTMHPGRRGRLQWTLMIRSQYADDTRVTSLQRNVLQRVAQHKQSRVIMVTSGTESECLCCSRHAG